MQTVTFLPLAFTLEHLCGGHISVTVLLTPVAPAEIVLDERKTFEVEVTTTETRTWKKKIIGVDSRQDETRSSEIKRIQMAPLSERGGGDDWFVLFDIVREKPLVVPPGTSYYQRACT